MVANISLPEQASTVASDVDLLYNTIMWISITACFLLIGAMIYFAIKYRRRSDSDKPPFIPGSHKLEFVWTIIPTIVFVGMAIWGVVVFHNMENPPANAFAIHASAQKWAWNFQYANGKQTLNELYVPVGEPIVMQMTSKDVLHSFFIPSFRVKKDVVPGYRSQVWFNALRPGTYQLFCAEFCGTGHSKMLAKVIVQEKENFLAWYNKVDQSQKTLAERGADLFRLKGCVACHSVDGANGIGPSLKGLWESQREFETGEPLKADANYIRESLLNPQAKIVKGFTSTKMIPFQGQLSEDEITQIIEYIKNLK